MNNQNHEIKETIAKETLHYATRKIALEHTITGKPVPGKAKLIQLAKERIEASAVKGEVL